MNNGMYKHVNGVPKNTGTKTEITIGGKKFELKGQKDTLEMMKVVRTHTESINKLQSEHNVIAKNVRVLANQYKELDQKIKNLEKLLKQLGNFGNDGI